MFQFGFCKCQFIRRGQEILSFRVESILEYAKVSVVRMLGIEPRRSQRSWLAEFQARVVAKELVQSVLGFVLVLLPLRLFGCGDDMQAYSAARGTGLPAMA